MIHDKTAYFAKHERAFDTKEHTSQQKNSVSIHACNIKKTPNINDQFYNWESQSYICTMFQQYRAWHSVLVLDSTCYFVWWSEIMHLCEKSIAMLTVIWVEHIIWLSDNCLHEAVLNLASLCITQQMPQISITFVAQDEFVTSRICWRYKLWIVLFLSYSYICKCICISEVITDYLYVWCLYMYSRFPNCLELIRFWELIEKNLRLKYINF